MVNPWTKLFGISNSGIHDTQWTKQPARIYMVMALGSIMAMSTTLHLSTVVIPSTKMRTTFPDTPTVQKRRHESQGVSKSKDEPWLNNKLEGFPRQSELNRRKFRQGNVSLETQQAPSMLESKSTALPTKIIAFCNWRYREPGLNWYRQLESLGYTQHELVTMDDESYQYFTTNFTDIRVAKVPYPFCLYQKITHEGRPQKDYRRQLFPRRWMYIYDLLQAQNAHILLTDVDNYFTSFYDVEQFAKTDRDMFLAYETTYPEDVYYGNGFVTCGGMSWMRATSEGVRSLIHNMLQTCQCLGTPFPCKRCRCDDQVIWNRMLWRSRNQRIRRTYMVLWDNATDVTPATTLQKNPVLAGNSSTLETLKISKRSNPRGERTPKSTDQSEWIWQGRYGIVTPFRNMSDRVGWNPTENDVILKVGIWDRDFAFRAKMPKNESDCPLLDINWVAMPVGVRRAHVAEFWNSVCRPGTNNTK